MKMNKFKNNVYNCFHQLILLWNQKFLIPLKSTKNDFTKYESSNVLILFSYFRHGGAPDQVIELLSDNYMAIAQTATLMADWLILTGVEPADVVNMIVQHLQTLIEKHFEPKKADSIFEAGGVNIDFLYREQFMLIFVLFKVPSWLTDMTEHMNWRSMIYKLAEEYPNCLMLNFTIKVKKQKIRNS